jgi:glycosyltransferase involved in cell wall biosynthesis
MLLSIIVPVYNAQETLDPCVRSVLDQGFRDFELILVNDGSRDESPQICDRYVREDNRVVVIHQENQGVSSARNAGIRKARGEYLVQLDNDDYFVEDGLALIVKHIQLAPDADVLAWHAFQLRQGRVEEETFAFPETEASQLKGELAFDFLFCSNHGSWWQVWRYVSKRCFIIQNDLFYRLGVIHEDIDHTPHIVLRANKVLFCVGAYYVYRCAREGSVTSTMTAPRCKDMILLVKRWFEFLETSRMDPSVATRFRETLSRIVWDYVPAVIGFPEPDKNKLLELLRENKPLLKWVKVPRRSALVKRILLATLGISMAARVLGMLRLVRN